MKMIKWPSIEQFRNVIKNVQHRAAYGGQDAEGNAIYLHHLPKPALRFQGTVKLHGTNASVALSVDGDIWAQSRENIITVEKDNAGFAQFTEANKENFKTLLGDAAYSALSFDELQTESRPIVVFGEWCGGNIQKGVALSELPKMFVIFGIAFANDEGNKQYLTREQIEYVVKNHREFIGTDHPIKCIYDFPSFEMVIDFEHPELSQNELGRITEEVEKQCPVGFALGVDGVGEGVVWRCIEPGYEDSGFWFKVKGEKHSASKVKTLAAVDVERVNSIKECVEKTVTESRLKQGLEHLTQNQLEHDVKNMGAFLKWISGDLAKEELDTITASGLEFKEVVKEAQRVARTWFLAQLGI